jgi:hypothetical protein
METGGWTWEFWKNEERGEEEIRNKKYLGQSRNTSSSIENVL